MIARLRRELAFFLAVAALAAPAFAQERPSTPAGWRAVAISDLEATRDILRAQTPIPFDTENAAYPAWLEQGYAAARERAEETRDESGYFFALSRYLNGFHDPHINVSPSGSLPSPRWPGFVAASRAGGAIVVMRDENDAAAPPIGAQILSCEARSLESLAEERIFPYVLNARIALDRRRAITRLFMDRGIPGAPPPASCRIAHGGEERDIALHWRALPENQDSYWSAYQTAATGSAAEWGVTEPAPGVVWIGIPTFSSGSETAPRLEQLIREIDERGAAMRNGRAIVIDVRGNGGGNSEWAERIAAAVFGDPVASRAARASSGESAIDWRASPENIAYWREWVTQVAIPEFGEGSDAVSFAQDAIDGMQGALDRDPPLWRQGPDRVAPSGGLTQRRPRGGASPFPARVYLLSNGTCGSSCLNFADTVLFVPGVQLIGSDTSGDGPYMEVRNVTLPSGLARLTIPQKVWRGMGRGALEAYQADIAYDGAWDDASVRAWVMGLIAAQ